MLLQIVAVIFKTGLYNYNDLGIKSKDISNTVYYSTNLDNLIRYIPLGPHKDETTIILKFPIDVFSQERNVF